MSWTSSVMQCCDINQRLRSAERKAAISKLGSRVATDPLGSVFSEPALWCTSRARTVSCVRALWPSPSTKIWRKKCKCRKRLKGKFLSLAFHFLPQDCFPLSNRHDGYAASNTMGKSFFVFFKVFSCLKLKCRSFSLSEWYTLQVYFFFKENISNYIWKWTDFGLF